MEYRKLKRSNEEIKGARLEYLKQLKGRSAFQALDGRLSRELILLLTRLPALRRCPSDLAQERNFREAIWSEGEERAHIARRVLFRGWKKEVGVLPAKWITSSSGSFDKGKRAYPFPTN